MPISKHFKSYFKDRSNIAVLIVLIIAIGFGAFTRLSNLGSLSYWWDDGQTYLGTLGVLKYGYPLLPSGNVMYHTIFSFYLRAIPALVSGLDAVTMRLPSAFFGICTIPLIFLFGKQMVNKYIGLLAAVIASLNLWMVEFSREARYYSEFQFFYLLTVFFFYLGFFKDRRKFRIPSLILIFVTSLILHQGFTLIFLFIPLLIYKGYKKFFKKDIMVPLAITAFLMIIQLVHRFFFWNVGINVYETSVQSANPVIRLVGKFITGILPDPFFFDIFKTMFPGMYYALSFGLILLLVYIFVKYARNRQEDWKNIYKKNIVDFKLPFNLFFLYFIIFSNLYFTGVGPMNLQQRYVFYIFPFMILGYCYIIFDIGRLIAIPVVKIGPGKLTETKAKILKNMIYFIIPLVILLLTINNINPVDSYKITKRVDGDPVNRHFSPSNAASMHYDFNDPGTFVSENKEAGDIVISTELLNMYPYTKQFDYWLWSSEETSWKPYDETDGIFYDRFFKSMLLRDAIQFLDVLNENQDKNIWLVTTYSLFEETHINPEIRDFITSQDELLLFEGDDRSTRVYYFPKEENGERFYNLAEDIVPLEDQIVPFGEKKLVLDFSDTKNAGYLKYGWADMEPHGTWAILREASLFINFDERTDYLITIKVKPLFAPDTHQTIKLYFNQELIGERVLDSPEDTTLSFKIPYSIIELDKFNRLGFRFKYVKKPVDLGISQDLRLLSVLFKNLEIEKE